MIYSYEKNGVRVYASSLLSHVPHGFSTRVGGVSVGVALGSSNMGFGKEDFLAVRENRRRFAAAAGLPVTGEDIIISATEQIHSGTVFSVTSSDAEALFRGDGFVTTDPCASIGVKTADCVPILFATRDGKAVAAVHAGWRGTASGIAAVAVERLCLLGYEPSDIVAATGPAVQGDEYRVGDNFAELLYELMSESESSAVRENARRLSEARLARRADGLYCDLPRLNFDILTLTGVMPESIDVCEVSTVKNAEHFYSHRRQGANRGVMLSAVAPKTDF